MRNFSKGSQYVKSGQMTFGNDAAQRAAEGWRSSMDQVEQAGDKFSASLSRSQRISDIEQWTQNNGGTVNSNITDPVLEKVAKERFGGDKAAATRWATNHSNEWKEEGNAYIKNWIKDTADWMDHTGRTSFTESDMSERFQDYSQSLKENSSLNLKQAASPSENSGFFGSHGEGSFTKYEGSLSKGSITEKREEAGLGESFRSEMSDKQNTLQAKVEAHQSAALPSHSIQEQGAELGEKYEERYHQSLTGRQVRNIVSGASQSSDYQQSSLLGGASQGVSEQEKSLAQSDKNPFSFTQEKTQIPLSQPSQLSQSQQRIIDQRNQGGNDSPRHRRGRKK